MTLVPTSLTGRLVATVVALVAVVGVLVGTVTTLAMREYLSNQLDQQVLDAAARGARPFEDGPRGDLGPPPSFGGDEDDEYREARGQGAGTLTAFFPTGSSGLGNVITSRSGLREVSTSALAVLQDVPADGRVHTVDLPAFGQYRVTSDSRGPGTVVIGLPTQDINDAIGSLIGYEVLLTALGVAVAGGVGLVLVRRQMKPLQEVAATAHEVAGLPLDSGEIGTTVRVPAEHTDPRSEVGQVGAALNTLLAHMESALDARHRSEQQVRQFVADASHELRTPLTTIQGYAELSRRTHDGAPAALAKVEAEAHRMSDLVEDLLLLARLDAGRPLARDRVDLTHLVLECVADARVVAPDHRWLLDLPDEPVEVTGDEQRLHQALTNLIGNARRHTPEGTTVTVGLCRSPGSPTAPGGVELRVHDDGPGLPADLVSTAFERFSRGDSARTRASGGAGLGLSLAEAIAEAHDGRATVTSSPGDTTFVVHLPLAG
ncbi:sensor histidine kinase [Nocardioides iriomotensis]|uniref:histidine kinase n=1 Tax=Nocardioides iriomotensis TaxID=715784 RepID=A0A4Q5IXZ5_9ACTN|nr:HAMP domain-containing sensor histidine kinase [Nocardioides iriomotensis]RYU11002.1 HAMP domain-containing histidine kinase [Nocardioides iriomotensis]